MTRPMLRKTRSGPRSMSAVDESDDARAVTLMRGYEAEQNSSQRAVGRGRFRRASDLIPAGDAHAVDPGERRFALCGKTMVRVEGLWPPGSFDHGCPDCQEAASKYGQRADG